MSKARRRVTVDVESTVPDDAGKRKPSVFERLGPGGAQRKYEEPRSDAQYLDKCRNWLLTGTCSFGSQCKFQHGPFIGKRKSKSSTSRKEESPEELRLRVKPNRVDSDSTSPDPHMTRLKRDEMKIKSTVVVKKSSAHDSDNDTEDSDNWAVDKLDYKKELELEQKRQQLQRELSQLNAMDDERENITIEKKIIKPIEQRPASDKSDTDHSPDRDRFLSKKKSPITPKKEKKRKHKQRSPASRSPSPTESPVKLKGHKKKYERDEEIAHKGKHKKSKKLLKKQMEKSPEIGALRTKKKHSLKQPDDKLVKSGRDFPPVKVSPLRRSRSPLKSDRYKTHHPRSRTRSPSVSPEPVPKKIIPDFVREGLKEGKYKIKKKKEKIREVTPHSDHEQKSHQGKKKVSPMKIKKKNKAKHEVPVPKIKDDIEEDLPERHTDSEGRSGSSESYSRRREEETREQKDRDTLELKQRGGVDRYERRDRARTPSPKDRARSAYQEALDRNKKNSLDRKRERREEFEWNCKNLNQKGDRPKFGTSPKTFPAPEYSSPATERRDRSPEDRSRSRQDRYKEPEREARRREVRPIDDRRVPREAGFRAEEFGARGRSPSTHSRERGDRKERGDRPGNADRYGQPDFRPGQDPRGRFEEGFLPPFPDHPDMERPRYPDDREAFDPRSGRPRPDSRQDPRAEARPEARPDPRQDPRQDPGFDRGRRDDGSRDRYNRFPDDRSRPENFEGFDRRAEYSDRSRGRGRRGGYDNIPQRGFGPDRPGPPRGRYEAPPPFEDDRQGRRPEWDDNRPGEPFRPEREWPGRAEGRRDPSRDDRYEGRRDDRRPDGRQFGREGEEPGGRGRPDWRERMDGTTDRRPPELRDERADPVGRIDDRERERDRVASAAHPPVEWGTGAREGRGYERGARDDRVPPVPGFRDVRGNKGGRRDVERGYRDERDVQRDDKRYDGKRPAPDDKVARDERVPREERGVRDEQPREERAGREDRTREDRAPREERGIRDEQPREERAGREDRTREDRTRDERIAKDDKTLKEERPKDERAARDEKAREERSEREGHVPRTDDRGRPERDTSRSRDRRGKDVHPRSLDSESHDFRARKDERGTTKDEDVKLDLAKPDRVKESKRDESFDHRTRDAKDKDDAHKHDKNSAKDDVPSRDSKTKLDDGVGKDTKKRGKSHKKPAKWPPRSFDDVESDGESTEELGKEPLKKDDKRSGIEETKSKSPILHAASSRKGSRSPRKRSVSPSKPTQSPSRTSRSPVTKRRRSPSKPGRSSSRRDRSLDSRHSHSSSRRHRSRSPPRKRGRDLSPSESHHGQGGAGRGRSDKAAPSLKQLRGEESDHEEKRSTAGSLDLERKSRRKGSNSEGPRKDKARSLSPQPASRKVDDAFPKSDKAAKRKRSSSGVTGPPHEGHDKREEAKRRRLSERDNAKDTKMPTEEGKKSAVVSPEKKSFHDSDIEGNLGTESDVDVFSDWSEDDLADNILNQDDEKLMSALKAQHEPSSEALQRVKDERSQRSPSNSSRGSRSSRRSQGHSLRSSRDSAPRLRDDKVKELSAVKGDPKERTVKDVDVEKPVEKARRVSNHSDDVKKEGDVGLPEYESISSDEEEFLEEEPPKTNITDILDIDWSVLKQESKQKPVKSSVLDTFKPSNIFSRIGVSKKYAGAALFEKVKEVCQKEVEEITKQQGQDGASDKEESKPKGQDFTVHHDVASFHCYLSRVKNQRARLLTDLGPNRRALCARRDLEMRQQLCKVDKVFDQTAVYPSQVMDMSLCKLSVQLFRRGREHTPEKKQPLTPSPSPVPCQS